MVDAWFPSHGFLEGKGTLVPPSLPIMEADGAWVLQEGANHEGKEGSHSPPQKEGNGSIQCGSQVGFQRP